MPADAVKVYASVLQIVRNAPATKVRYPLVDLDQEENLDQVECPTFSKGSGMEGGRLHQVLVGEGFKYTVSHGSVKNNGMEVHNYTKGDPNSEEGRRYASIRDYGNGKIQRGN